MEFLLGGKKKQIKSQQMLMQWNDYVVFFSHNKNKLLLFHLIDKSVVDFVPNMEHPLHSWAYAYLNHHIILINGTILLKLKEDGTITRTQIKRGGGNMWCFMEQGKFLMSNVVSRTTALYQILDSQAAPTEVIEAEIVSLQSWPFITYRAIALSHDRFAFFVANTFQIWDLNEGMKVNIPIEFTRIYYDQPLIFDSSTNQIVFLITRNMTARQRCVYLVDYLMCYNLNTKKHNFKKPFQFRHIDNKIELGVARSISQRVTIRKVQISLDGTLYLLMRKIGKKNSCLVTFDLLTHELKQYTTPSITDFLILRDRRILCQNRDSLFLLD